MRLHRQLNMERRGLVNALRVLAQSLGTESDAELYGSLVIRLASQVKAETVLLFDIAEDKSDLRALACCGRDSIAPAMKLSLAGVPGAFASRGYLGVPLVDAAGRPPGLPVISW